MNTQSCVQFDSKVIHVGNQGVLGMFGDHLKSVVLGNLQHFYHRLIDDVADPTTIFDRLPFHDVDAHERHLISPHS